LPSDILVATYCLSDLRTLKYIMLSNDSPPARHTCTANKPHRISARDPQNTPPQEETLNLTQDSLITQLTSADTPDESLLSSIFKGPGKEIEQSEWDDSHEDNMNSNHGIIHEITEEFDTTQNDPEQSFLTAPISIGPSAGPVSITLPSKVRLDKGKGHARSTPVQEEGSPQHRNKREILPQMSMPGET
jgi:hypothetical protein